MFWKLCLYNRPSFFASRPDYGRNIPDEGSAPGPHTKQGTTGRPGGTKREARRCSAVVRPDSGPARTLFLCVGTTPGGQNTAHLWVTVVTQPTPAHETKYPAGSNESRTCPGAGRRARNSAWGTPGACTCTRISRKGAKYGPGAGTWRGQIGPRAPNQRLEAVPGVPNLKRRGCACSHRSVMAPFEPAAGDVCDSVRDENRQA